MYDSTNVVKNHESQKSIVNNNYTRQKLEAEKIALEEKSIILRTNFFGFSKIKNNKTFTDWLYSEALKNSKLTLFKDVKFNPLGLISFCKIIKKIIKRDKKNIFGIYNLGCRNGLSKAEFAQKFLNKFKKLRYININVDSILKVKRSKNMIMNVNKIQKKYNIRLPEIKKEIQREIKNYTFN